VWAALCGPHGHLSARHADLRWYPPSIAPFVAIPTADILPDLESAHHQGLGAHLIAMAGERMALSGLQEISGVCTHPDFAGRGYARRLTSALLSLHRRRGVGSFLHVSEGNSVARRLYESMGFAVRASLPMCKVECFKKPAAP
jgi:GNAT superfamily N-acetyltransferase